MSKKNQKNLYVQEKKAQATLSITAGICFWCLSKRQDYNVSRPI